MPKRGYQPNSHVYLRHWVWRPDRELLIGEGDLRGKMGSPTFRKQGRVSPHINRKEWKVMRSQNGGSGWNACYKPLVVEKKEIVFSNTFNEDLLKLPEKSFFAINNPTHRRNGFTRLEQTTLALPPAQRATPEEYAYQTVPRKASSYSGHLKKPPTKFAKIADGGQQPPSPNKFIQKDETTTDAYLDSLKEALGKRPVNDFFAKVV
eukprot:TRINITY_DN42217_c0_g1_i1.p1 TRINITY_DN42217_c0_g1~~TRINITY_DN42217_c0_g1_i1.p1  ORF type:complete len:222 (+),score=34.67 TRINITY_DN42217_c0_g1_i1:50-667(+)